jgi:hypothetical protein
MYTLILFSVRLVYFSMLVLNSSLLFKTHSNSHQMQSKTLQLTITTTKL